MDSTYWQAWNDLATIHAGQGDAAAAAVILERVTRARPGRPEPWVNLAHCYRALGRVEEAVPAYGRALAASNYMPILAAELMQLHLQRGDADAARKVLGDALEHRPADRGRLLHFFARLQSPAAPSRRR